MVYVDFYHLLCIILLKYTNFVRSLVDKVEHYEYIKLRIYILWDLIVVENASIWERNHTLLTFVLSTVSPFNERRGVLIIPAMPNFEAIEFG
jgi:hypothetical protein